MLNLDSNEIDQVCGGALSHMDGMYWMARAVAKVDTQEKTKREAFLQGKVFTQKELMLATFRPY